MTVLNESTIKEYLDAKLIVAGGDKQHVRGPSYSCHAAKVFPGGPGSGHEPSVLDWTNPTGKEYYRIEPRQLVWVRIREIVHLPEDVCAFWWQTNTLSRKGLMLVNMSMVDPGYQGCLACLFVNFGKLPVDIDPGMTIARLAFHRLDKPGSAHVKSDLPEVYDRELRNAALQGPSSFLSFQEFSEAFETERDKAFVEFKRQTDIQAGTALNEIKTKVDELFNQKTDDLPKLLIKSSAVAACALALLIAASTATPWIKDYFSSDRGAEIADAVEVALAKHMQPISTLNDQSTQAFDQRIQQLETQLRSLQQALHAPKATGN